MAQWRNGAGVEFTQSISYLRQYGWTKNLKLAQKQKMSKEQHYQELLEIAEKRGGKVISKEYINCKTIMEFEDSYGNKFKTLATKIKSGTWSPFEKTVSEHICRQAFNYIYQCNFELRNDIVRIDGRPKPLQLDGYAEVRIDNKFVKIAFEYQGHQGHRKFEVVKKRDREKKEFCSKNNIFLVIIDPFIQSRMSDDLYIINMIVESIKVQQYPLPNNINYSGFQSNFTCLNHCQNEYNRWKLCAEQSNYTLLSEKYINNSTPLLWKKNDTGQTFELATGKISYYGWPKWSKNSISQMKSSAEHFSDVKKIARLRGGKILSIDYVSATEKMQAMDVSGNIFLISASCIKRGSWSVFETGNANASRKRIGDHVFITTAHGDKIEYQVVNGVFYLRKFNEERFIWRQDEIL